MSCVDFFDDDDHDPDLCVECQTMETLSDRGLRFSSRSLIFDVPEFMELSIPETDALRLQMAGECSRELYGRNIAPIGPPAVRWKAILDDNEQPVLIEVHCTLFGVPMVGFENVAADILERMLTEHHLRTKRDNDDDDG